MLDTALPRNRSSSSFTVKYRRKAVANGGTTTTTESVHPFRTSSSLPSSTSCWRLTRQSVLLWLLVVIGGGVAVSAASVSSIVALSPKCSAQELGSCMNGGVCVNGTCLCADGWQGDECQFCGGKVRWVRDLGDQLEYTYIVWTHWTVLRFFVVVCQLGHFSNALNDDDAILLMLLLLIFFSLSRSRWVFGCWHHYSMNATHMMWWALKSRG